MKNIYGLFVLLLLIGSCSSENKGEKLMKDMKKGAERTAEGMEDAAKEGGEEVKKGSRKSEKKVKELFDK